MYFKLGKGIAWLVSIKCLLLVSGVALAKQTQKIEKSLPISEISFTAQPANCVSLRQGRKCYASVSFIWHAPNKGNFCIFQKNTKTVIQCWKNSRSNQVLFEFESEETREYQLINTEDNRVFAETSIDVSWVHKQTPRKRRWRLF